MNAYTIQDDDSNDESRMLRGTFSSNSHDLKLLTMETKEVKEPNPLSLPEMDVKENIRQNNKNHDPPLIMHTFYNRHNDPMQNQLEVKNHQKVLQIWSETWKAMGYQTKILTLDDAKEHPHYAYFQDKLNHIPLDGYSGTTGNYNRLCYLRWLAMGTDHVNGGFFSDFDVVPLKPPAPEDYSDGLAKFHVYEDGYVPSLLSGSKEEWNRMLHMMIGTAQGHENDQLHSDMMALQELGINCKCQKFDEVMEGKHVLTGKDLEEQDCQELSRFRAVHFSHNAIRKGVLKTGHGMSDRYAIMLEWWKSYIETCGSLL